MDIQLHFRKIHLLVFGVLLAFFIAGFAFAYNSPPTSTNTASTFGHSVEEIQWSQLKGTLNGDNGGCAAGYYMQKINNDGSVVCAQDTVGSGGSSGGGEWSVSSGDVYRLSGNVGIGTPNPKSKLHVSGGALTVTQPDESIALDVSGNKYIRFRDGITNEGYVGIYNGEMNVIKQGSGNIKLWTEVGDITLDPHNKLCLKGNCINSWSDLSTTSSTPSDPLTGLTMQCDTNRLCVSGYGYCEGEWFLKSFRTNDPDCGYSWSRQCCRILVNGNPITTNLV